jgi:hypothetical protein
MKQQEKPVREILGVIPGSRGRFLKALAGVQEAESRLSAALRGRAPVSWWERLRGLGQEGEDPYTCWRRLGHSLEVLELAAAELQQEEASRVLGAYQRIHAESHQLILEGWESSEAETRILKIRQEYRWLEEVVDPLAERLERLDKEALLRDKARKEVG